MKMCRILFCFVLLLSLCRFAPQTRINAQPLPQSHPGEEGARALHPGRRAAHQFRADAYAHIKHLSFPEPSGGGIREEIADKYKERYQEWKDEFVSTETGRRQWESYVSSPRFVLTITIVRDNRNGAGTSKYKWDDAGNLIAATITLGNRIDEGYPNPIYYPVMNSLAPGESSYGVSGRILAATKIAHEFGHLNRMASTNAALYRLQSQLIPAYNTILLSNGLNTRDPSLLDLARQMGGTPVEIWEDREYWGEANAMLYLRDRITKESFQCSLFTRIKRTVELYAKSYAERFVEIAQSRPFPNQCTWQ